MSGVRPSIRTATNARSVMMIVAALTATLVWPARARATIMEPLSTRQLVARATTVAEGTVVGQRVVRMDGRLWTESRIRVSRGHKLALDGGRSELLRIRQPGGEQRNEGLYVAGAATFRIGERVLVFARPVGAFHVVVGMCLGKYTIFRDRQGVERVRRDLSGASFVQLSPTGSVLVTPSVRVLGAPKPELARLRATIATIVAASARPAGGGR